MTERRIFETTKTATDTKVDTKPAFDFENVFKAHKFSAPTVNPNRQKQQSTPQPRNAQPLDALTPTADMPRINPSAVGTDTVSDQEALRRSGRTNTTIGVDPEPRQPGTDLAAICNDIAAAGRVQPNFRQVSDLPGYIANAIRAMGRTVFSAYTSTPLEEIQVLANVGGQGPNTQAELNAVAGWARANATEDQRASEAAIANFGNAIPGYEPQLNVYDAGGTTFMVVQDNMGRYVYSWPTSTDGPALNGPAETNRLAGQRNNAPRLTRESVMDFKSFLVLG